MLSRILYVYLLLILVAVAASAASPSYRIEPLAEGLEHPWSLAFMPDGRLLVTERAGRLRMIENGQLHPEAIGNVPAAYAVSQGGLFEVLLHPGFEDNGWIYLSLAYGDAQANTTFVIRGRLKNHRLVDVETVFNARPTRDTAVHYGGRMLFLPDNTLLVTVGDGFDYREEAQKLNSHLGSIVRINDDGSVPEDNPFAAGEDALPEIFSFGHRNSQGLVQDSETGIIWSHEHGPRGGDELNIIRAGANYGWPIATHGRDYSGAVITPHKRLPGIEDPLRVWTPAIAPAGIIQYRGEQFPEWVGDLFIAGLVAKSVIRIPVNGNRAGEETRIFGELDERIRDVKTGPDGALYLLTDSTEGRVLRVTRQ